MAKAAFIAPHTLGYIAGFIAVGMGMLVWSHGGLGNTAMQETAARGVGIIFLGLTGAALFSFGCAWAGVHRLPRTTWAFAAGVVTGAGLFALWILSDASPPSTDLRSLEQRGYYSAISTAYFFLAPTIAGLLSAWLWRRMR